MAETKATRRNGRVKDLSGRKFSRLTVLSYAGNDRNKQATWECRCDCGAVLVVASRSLMSGNTTSCGCYQRKDLGDRRRKHGHTRADDGSPSAEYRTWRGMLNRCTNPRTKGYPWYGGRGISVCERWAKSFEAFLEDMGPRPSTRHSIDRIDNDGSYEPGNCRWATVKEQCRNKRNTLFVCFNGENRPLIEWCEILGLPYVIVARRLYKGWSTEKAFFFPVQSTTHQ